MVDRPFILLSAAMSLDGFLDDAGDARLMLSNDADLDRVDSVRAGCDAILVGANTIRRDDPRLLVRSADRRAERVARGLPETPVKVTLAASGGLDPAARFFTTGDGLKLVYSSTGASAVLAEKLAGVATVVDVGDPIDLTAMLADLSARGVRRLMVEGGSTMHTQFLTAGLADELHIVIAPFFVGDHNGTRFVSDGVFPQSPNRPMTLAEVRQLDDVVLLRYTGLAA